jgi:hypothetical protein
MKFQVGDKVKFMSTTGGGIVSRIISPTMVNVMIEDGFEIPTITSDLVKIEPQGKAERMFDDSRQPASREVRKPAVVPESYATKQKPMEIPAESLPDRQTPIGNYSFLARNTPGVYLAFVPHDQKWLVTGTIEVYLVNHTQSDVLYAFFLEDENSIAGKDYDILFRQNKIMIDAIERDDLLKWTKGLVQLIFFDERPEKVYLPVSSEFEISTSRFNDEQNYRNTQFMEERLLLISVAQVAGLTTQVGMEAAKKTEVPEIRQKATEVRPGALIEKHQTGPREAVVDLHIGELLSEFAHMSPHEILQYQMAYFERCVESAADRNLRKITFIHGVGNGSLKSAIIRRVQEYEHAESHLASLEKFGVGALDVIIKPLK